MRRRQQACSSACATSCATRRTRRRIKALIDGGAIGDDRRHSPSRTGRLVPLRPLLRSRSMAAGRRVRPDAADEGLPRPRLAQLPRRRTGGTSVIVRLAHAVHRREQADRCGGPLHGVRHRTGVRVLGRGDVPRGAGRPRTGGLLHQNRRSGDDSAAVDEALRSGPYGRCVFAADNDVVDHQVVSVEYSNGVTAAFTVTAATRHEDRRTSIFGSRGQITTDGSTVELYDFASRSSERFDVRATAAVTAAVTPRCSRRSSRPCARASRSDFRRTVRRVWRRIASSLPPSGRVPAASSIEL